MSVEQEQFLNKVMELALKEKDKGVAWNKVADLRKAYGIGKQGCRTVILNSGRFILKPFPIQGHTRVFINSVYLEYGIKEQKTQSKPKQGYSKEQGKIVARKSHNVDKYTHVIYKFMDVNGTVIYIGRAKRLENRLNSHGHLPKECYKEIESIHYTKFSTEDDLDIAEPYYISKYKPKYNKDFKNKRYSFSIDFLENKKWKNYDSFDIL